jgi:hypothetical protein
MNQIVFAKNNSYGFETIFGVKIQGFIQFKADLLVKEANNVP